MATLILTSVGTALGGPIGGALGSLVGQSLDRGLFGPGMRKGPRLGDLAVQTSSYGSPIPRVYGRMRVAGTVVWATDLQEEENLEGGGKGSPERTTYSYSANLAVALSSRPIQSVGRIWADGKLLRGANGDFKVKTKFRLHPGGEDQPIDPLIGSVETIAKTPAFRGVALAVFEGLELTEFGNRIPMLTFEVEADADPIDANNILRDASAGAIQPAVGPPIIGFAAHGTSIRDSLESMIDLAGIELVEQDGRLGSPPGSSPILIGSAELGCDADGNERAKLERRRGSQQHRPSGLALGYYDPDRDYQAGQLRASTGQGGAREERIELPAVLTAAQAKQMAEQLLAKRWRQGNRLVLRLPPSRMRLRPGDPIQLTGSATAWTAQRVSIDGLCVVVEAEMASNAVPPLPADSGRASSEPDVPIGRSEVALFELPSEGDEPASAVRVHAAASNDGCWKPVPLELSLDGAPVAGIAVMKRAVMGRAETSLEPRSPAILDELSSVRVRLACSAQLLLNADDDALMAGANLALIGDELIQFARAEQLEPGLYRLSRLLRGRRATEWAAGQHAVGDIFCLIDHAATVFLDQPPSTVGVVLRSIAHGVGDFAPLPETQRRLSGEALRPPAPCHLTATRDGPDLRLTWIRRSQRAWTWADAIGDPVDSFTARYRISARGPAGDLVAESVTASASLPLAQLPGQPGDQLTVEVATIGPMALSRPATTSIIL